MNAQQRKLELFMRLTDLGFTFEDAKALRRIEMTLHRWAERECNGEIERDDNGAPVRPILDSFSDRAGCRKIADRETGALKWLKAIVDARNYRMARAGGSPNWIVPFHQTDPRGCALYLVKASDLEGNLPIDSVYTRGLAVC